MFLNEDGTPRRPLTPGSNTGVQRVFQETGGFSPYPQLTRMNYDEWALVMQVMLEARGLWTAIHTGTTERDQDQKALEALLRSMPPEMISTLAIKASAREAWESLKTIYVGSNRIKKAKAQSLRKEYERLAFRIGESVDSFSMCLLFISSALAALGDTISEDKLVLKLLASVPKKYNQIALAIETLLDLDTLTIEDLTGRFKAAEVRDEAENGENSDNSMGKLLLTEEQWIARMKKKKCSSNGCRSKGNKSRDKNQNSDKESGLSEIEQSLSSDEEGSPKRNDECHYCGKKWHWARMSRKET